MADPMPDDLRLATDDGDDPFTSKEVGFTITCNLCTHEISDCICAADWLGYRALWVAASAEAAKLKRNQLDVDKVKADAQEFVDAALKDFTKQASLIEALQKALGNAISWLQLAVDTAFDKQQVEQQIAYLKHVLASSKD